MKKLSICIFAYKQVEQIKAQLDELVSYDGDDIEIIISDDTPDDSIKVLAESYKDERLRYVTNNLGPGADGNYLNAIMTSSTDYAWIFRSSDSAVADRIIDIINLITEHPDCVLYFPSSIASDGLVTREYKDKTGKEVWHSGTLHPSGYIINKKYCDFELYKQYISKYFDDYRASNVAFCLLQADLGLKGDTCFSKIPAWKYAKTVRREDKAVNAPGGKNPFGLEFEYKRYALMLDYASDLTDEVIKDEFIKLVIHTYAKQILHVFGKRNSSKDFLKHYGCEKVSFNPYKEKKIFIKETNENIQKKGVSFGRYASYTKKEAFIYGIIKPTIYRIKHKIEVS